MSLVSNLPAIPDDTGYSDYIIYENDGEYTVTFFDNLYSDTLWEEGGVDYGPYIYYTLDGSDWEYGGGYLGSHPVYNGTSRFGDIVQSTKTLYNPDGTVYIIGSRSSGLIVGSISSSDIMYGLTDLWAVAPLVVAAVLAFVAFRKAWGFIHGLIRGA